MDNGMLDNQMVVNSDEAIKQETIDKSGQVCCKYREEQFAELIDKVVGLQDLFVRRLNEDKQKAEMIALLRDGASFAFMEPFLYDIILLLDRLEKVEDDFALSVREELYDIIHRRGVELIEVNARFNPKLHKAVKVMEDSTITEMQVTEIIRNGYIFSGKVIRPAEVVVSKPS